MKIHQQIVLSEEFYKFILQLYDKMQKFLSKKYVLLFSPTPIPSLSFFIVVVDFQLPPTLLPPPMLLSWICQTQDTWVPTYLIYIYLVQQKGLPNPRKLLSFPWICKIFYGPIHECFRLRENWWGNWMVQIWIAICYDLIKFD